jgi:hypothetical protein
MFSLDEHRTTTKKTKPQPIPLDLSNFILADKEKEMFIFL